MTFVSAVMPTTAARSKYVAKSVQCFLKQTFHDVELVVLSDTFSASLAAIVDVNPRIRYVYGPLPDCALWETIGGKRNAINSMAGGRIIVNWDDDDWYAPDRIADQVGLLISSGKQVVGYHSMLYYRERDGGTFRYKYRGGGNYASGATQCYWKEYWAANPYPLMTIGEDSSFSMTAESKKCLVSTEGRGMIVVRAHGANTGKPSLGSHDFPAVPRTEFPQEFFEAERE